ncbi:MAG: hypothetical protein K2G01_09180 [Paramuribaculum sp.]|nr:hypothetical protein [Paramuribaculum sp.]
MTLFTDILEDGGSCLLFAKLAKITQTACLAFQKVGFFVVMDWCRGQILTLFAQNGWQSGRFFRNSNSSGAKMLLPL